MKTYNQVLLRANELKNNSDFMQKITIGDYYQYLKFVDIQELGVLKECVTEEEYKKIYVELTEKNVQEELANYLYFAFGKATGQRGISSNRSISHFSNWLWILEDIELLNFAKSSSNYGKDGGYGISILRKIRDKYKDFITKEKEEFIQMYGDR